MYLARPATGFLRSLDRTVDSAAAAADIDGDTHADPRARAARGRAGPCAAIEGRATSPSIADPEAALYLEVPSITCALRALADRVPDVKAALARLGRVAERRGGVSLEDELLPAARAPRRADRDARARGRRS